MIILIGLTLGGNFNYLLLVAVKLLLNHPQIGKIGLKTATFIGILETFSTSFILVNFYYIPQ